MPAVTPETAFYQAIGEELRRHRERHNLTREALGKAIGVGDGTIGRFENAKTRPSLWQITLILARIGGGLQIQDLVPPVQSPTPTTSAPPTPEWRTAQ